MATDTKLNIDRGARINVKYPTKTLVGLCGKSTLDENYTFYKGCL